MKPAPEWNAIQTAAHKRDKDRSDFDEVKRLVRDHGLDDVIDMARDAAMELRDEADDEQHNDPRHERRPAMPTAYDFTTGTGDE